MVDVDIPDVPSMDELGKLPYLQMRIVNAENDGRLTDQLVEAGFLIEQGAIFNEQQWKQLMTIIMLQFTARAREQGIIKDG